MAQEMARLSLSLTFMLNAVFTLYVIYGVLCAALTYKHLRRIQKFYFWISLPIAPIAVLWLMIMLVLLTYPVPMPHFMVDFLIYAFPIPAVAAGTTMGTILQGNPLKSQ